MLYLEKLIDTLGNPRAKADHHREQIASGSLLTEKLKNALGGTALTLLICCVSQSIKEADRTFYTLKFASKASNICNYPSQNVTLLFQDLDEEISFINQSKPTMPTMPDLINPFIMQPQMMQPQLMQQQMLHQMVNNYLLMFQQQQQQHQSPISPFVPISSPGSLDLKSPLNAQMIMNENNLPLNLPNEPSPEKNDDEKPKFNTKKERKNSLASYQKNLDSILEESENGSSTRKTSSISTIGSLGSCELVSSSDDSDLEVDDEDNENDDDFDSDCSIVSEELSEEINVDSILKQFERGLDETVKIQQDLIVDELLDRTWHKDPIQKNHEEDLIKKQQDLGKINKDLDELRDQITSLSELLKAKAQALDTATATSLEIKKEFVMLQTRLSEFKQEEINIKQELISANR